MRHTILIFASLFSIFAAQSAVADTFSFEPGFVFDFDCDNGGAANCQSEVEIPGVITVDFGGGNEATWDHQYKHGNGEFYVSVTVTASPIRDFYSVFGFILVSGNPKKIAYFNAITTSQTALNKLSTMTTEHAENNGKFHSGWITVQPVGAAALTKAALLKERSLAAKIRVP